MFLKNQPLDVRRMEIGQTTYPERGLHAKQRPLDGWDRTHLCELSIMSSLHRSTQKIAVSVRRSYTTSRSRPHDVVYLSILLQDHLLF